MAGQIDLVDSRRLQQAAGQMPQPLCSPTSHLGLDADLWFSANGSDESRLAKKTCLECPLYFRSAYSAHREGIPEGIWGGMDARERRAVWARNGGKPTNFLDDIDAAIGTFTNTFRVEEVTSRVEVA